MLCPLPASFSRCNEFRFGSASDQYGTKWLNSASSSGGESLSIHWNTLTWITPHHLVVSYQSKDSQTSFAWSFAISVCFTFLFWAVCWPWLHCISMFLPLSLSLCWQCIHALLAFLSALHVLLFCFRLQPQPIAIEEPLSGGGWAFRRGARGGGGGRRGQRGREKSWQRGALAEGGLSGAGRRSGASAGFGGERRGLAPEECLRDWPQVTCVEASTCRVLLTTRRPRSSIHFNFALLHPCEPVILALVTPTFTLLHHNVIIVALATLASWLTIYWGQC